MSWNDNAKNCIATYGVLLVTGQADSNTAMADLAKLQVQQLKFYNPLATDEINNTNASALAKVLESSYNGTCAGAYNDGYNRQKAVPIINGVLTNKTKTMADLADAIDPIYTFPAPQPAS